MAQHHVTVRPVRLEARDDVLRCRRLSGIGFAWRCDCGARGPIERTYVDARAGGVAHRETVEKTAVHEP